MPTIKAMAKGLFVVHSKTNFYLGPKLAEGAYIDIEIYKLNNYYEYIKIFLIALKRNKVSFLVFTEFS
jgi:hypothetical protein